MGTAICKRCGAWVNDRSWRCRSCGRLLPGLFGQRRGLDLLFSRSRSQARLLLAALAVFYVLELFISGATPDPGGRSRGIPLEPTGFGLVRSGALLPWDYVFSDLPSHATRDEPWRIVSAMLLHGGILHILFNGMSLLTLGMYIEALFGPARFWIVFTLTGVVGNVLALRFGGYHPLVGASGGIFGLLGAVLGFGVRRGGTWGAEIRRQTLQSLAINAVISFLPGISLLAHLGGAASGFLVTWLFDMPDGRGGRESDRARFAAVGCMALLAVCGIVAVAFAVRWHP
jgi:membrane associated rhomboid family serine protease